MVVDVDVARCLDRGSTPLASIVWFLPTHIYLKIAQQSGFCFATQDEILLKLIKGREKKREKKTSRKLLVKNQCNLKIVVQYCLLQIL